MSLDPTVTNSDHYKVIFENERVRVLSTRTNRETGPHFTNIPTA